MFDNFLLPPRKNYSPGEANPAGRLWCLPVFLETQECDPRGAEGIISERPPHAGILMMLTTPAVGRSQSIVVGDCWTMIDLA